ncbi:MAG: HAD family hydrolase [Candidatus Poribacteria bacterium]|nr:HAD family hydrolase [Candidatus Poribacteria bacterium]
MIKHIIFDADDTLFDFQKAEGNAKSRINEVLKTHALDLDTFWNRFNRVAPALFRQFADGFITIDEYRFHRFADVLEANHGKICELTSELNRIYIQEITHKIELFADAIPMFKVLGAKEIEAVILTNGPSDSQRAKFKNRGLSRFIQSIYIGEEMGFFKPNREAFEYVLRDLGAANSEVLMVGDSIEDDIHGAERAGIKAILIDRRNRYSAYTGTRIAFLSQLIELPSVGAISESRPSFETEFFLQNSVSKTQQ